MSISCSVKLNFMKHELKNEAGKIYFTLYNDANKGIFYADWYGTKLSLEQVKSGALLFLDELQEGVPSKLLNDNTYLEGVWDEANDWLAAEWMPAVIKKGLKKFAHVYSPEFFARLSAEVMQENSQMFPDGFELKVFENRDEAEKWLSEN